MSKDSYKFFSHTECEFYPCHEINDDKKFNCLFCYCPLYALGEKCGGNFKRLEDGTKDCSKCLVPHSEKAYDYMISRWGEIAELGKIK